METREFYNKVRTIVDTAIADIEGLTAQAKELDGKIKSNRYAATIVKNELMPQATAIKKQIDKRKYDSNAAIRSLADQYITELREANKLNPAALTDDIKLLQTGVILSATDLEMLFDRNAGNTTMQKLIFEYANQHGKKIERVYAPANVALIGKVDAIPEMMETALEWYHRPGVYDKLVGENSEFAQAMNG